MTERLAYSVAEIQEALHCGRRTAYRIANEIGIRISPRRIVVPAARLTRFLEGGETNGKAETAEPSAGTEGS